MHKKLFAFAAFMGVVGGVATPALAHGSWVHIGNDECALLDDKGNIMWVGPCPREIPEN